MDVATYIRFLLALVLVLGLILGLAWLLRYLGFGQGAVGPLTRRRRLRTLESAAIDGRHRVVLVRRDAVEHLILVGPNTSQVIETGIPAAPEDMAAAEAVQPPIAALARLFSRDAKP